MRRSSRLRIELPVRLRSLDPARPFDLLTRTVIVNAQGCGLQSTAELPVDVPVQLDVDDRVGTGKILNSALIDAERNIYLTGVVLDEPGNLWGIASPPADWPVLPRKAEDAGRTSKKVHPFAKSKAPKPNTAAPSAGAHPFARPAQRPPSSSPDPEPYHARIEVLLEEQAARLRTQAASEWEQWRATAADALTSLRNDLERKVAADAEGWRQETQRATETISELLKRGDEQARLVAQHAQQVESAVASAKANIAAAIKSLQRAASSTQATGDTAQRTSPAPQATEEELVRLRSELQQLTESAPGHVESLVKEKAGLVMDAVAADVQQKLSSVLTAGLQQLQQRVEEMAGAAAADVRSRLVSEFDSRQAAFLEAAAARIAEVEGRETSFRTSTDQLSAELARQTEEAMAGLRQQVEQASAASFTKLTASLDAGQQSLEARLQQQAWEYDAQAEAASARLQDKLTAALQRLESDIEKRQAALASGIAAEARKVTDESRSSLRGESERQAQFLREQIEAEFRRRQEDFGARQKELDAGVAALQSQHQQVAKDLAELHQSKSYIESLLAALPETIRAQAQQHATEAWEGLRDRSEKHHTEIVRAETERGAERLRKEIAESAKQLREEMAGHAQHTATTLQSKLSEILAQRQQQVAGELQAYIGQVEKRAAAAVSAAEERLQRAAQGAEAVVREGEGRVRRAAEVASADFSAQAQRQAELHRQQAEAVHEEARRRLEQVVQRSDQLLGETEAALLKSAGEVVTDEMARAQRELRERAASESAAALAALREGSEKLVASHAAAIDTAAVRASGAADQLQTLETNAEAKSLALQKQLEEAQRWLQEQSAEFQSAVHDAFLSAGGEIRGRVRSAVDTAEELIRQKSKDAISQMEAAANEQVEAVACQADELESRINGAQTNVLASTEKALQARLGEALELFRTDALRLAESTLSRWQSAMDDTLRAIPELLKNKLDGSTDVPAGTGDQAKSAAKD